MTRFTRVAVLASFAVVFLATACKPGSSGPAGDPLGLDTCSAPSQCAADETCNPGSLFCVKEVTVGADEFAGSFEELVPQSGTGLEQSVYIKVNQGGAEELVDGTMIMDSSSTDLVLAFRGNIDVASPTAMSFFIPLSIATGTTGVDLPIRDGLDPADPTSGMGFLETLASDMSVSEMRANVATGVVRINEMSPSADGMVVRGVVHGTLMPPSMFTADTVDCPSGFLRNPITLACDVSLPLAAGALEASLDTVYGTGSPAGFTVASYASGAEVQSHRVGTGVSFVYQTTSVVAHGSWLTSDTDALRTLQVSFATSSLAQGATLTIGSTAAVSLFDENNALITTATSGTVRIRYYRDGTPNGRILLGVRATLGPPAAFPPDAPAAFPQELVR